MATTTEDTGQQWDAPNGWAPLQWIAIDGLRRNGQNDLAAKIAEAWVAENARVYCEAGKLVEKYNVRDAGAGAGGEYPVQDGFGWTNAVLIKLLAIYPKLGAKRYEFLGSGCSRTLRLFTDCSRTPEPVLDELDQPACSELNGRRSPTRRSP